jgi:hypothetical protein
MPEVMIDAPKDDVPYSDFRSDGRSEVIGQLNGKDVSIFPVKLWEKGFSNYKHNLVPGYVKDGCLSFYPFAAVDPLQFVVYEDKSTFCVSVGDIWFEIDVDREESLFENTFACVHYHKWNECHVYIRKIDVNVVNFFKATKELHIFPPNVEIGNVDV